MWRIPVQQLIYFDADVMILDLNRLISAAQSVLGPQGASFAAAPLDTWSLPWRLNIGVMFLRPNASAYDAMMKALDKELFFSHPVMKQGGFLDQAWLDLWWSSPQSAKATLLPITFNLPVSFPALNWDPVGKSFCVDRPIVVHFMGDAWKPFDRSHVSLMSRPEIKWWKNYHKWCQYRKASCSLRAHMSYGVKMSAS